MKIKTLPIALRHINRNDYLAIKNYVTNENVAKYLTWEKYTNEKDIQEYFNKIISKDGFPDEVFAITLNNLAIGTVHLIYRKGDLVQFGMGIMPEFWHQGIGTLVINEIKKYLKHSTWNDNVSRLLFDVHELNENAILLAKKSNFKFAGKINEKNRIRYYLNLNE